MKVRTGFVSNSSSSIFCIIDKGGVFSVVHASKEHLKIKVPQTYGGQTNFTRCHNEYESFGDKLNFAFLMAYSMDKFQSRFGTSFPTGMGEEDFWKEHTLNEYKNLVNKIREVIKTRFWNDHQIMYHNIEVFLDTEDEDNDEAWDFWWDNLINLDRKDAVIAGIDHQSSWMQSPENLLIFNHLNAFLFGPHSMIIERGDEEETKYQLSKELSKYDTIVTLPKDEIDKYVEF